MYADDVILLSTTVTDLQRMFNLCSEIFSDLDLPINVDKCPSLRIGPRCDNICCTLQIQGQAVHWVDSIKFLGITLCKAKTFKCAHDDAKRKFYCSSNVILGRLGSSAPANVLLKLINAHGVQNLLYGISAATLTESEIKSLLMHITACLSKFLIRSITTLLLVVNITVAIYALKDYMIYIVTFSWLN